MRNFLIIFVIFLFNPQWNFVNSQREIGDDCIVQTTRQAGICQIISQCQAVLEIIRQQRPTVCGYQGAQIIVCCPNPPPTPAPTVQIPDYLLNSTRNRKCIEYADAVYQVSERFQYGTIQEVKIDRCGMTAVPHIIHYLPDLQREFPHSAILGFTTINGSIVWGCGGSLISPNYIVTAGQCLISQHYGNVTHVRLGDLNIDLTNDDARPETILIAERISHPNYTSLSYYNDIALLKLERSVTLNPYIRPICLPLEKATINTKAITTGWGNVGWSTEENSSLFKVTLDLFSHAECNESYRYNINRKLKLGIVDDTQVCAGSKSTERKNTCLGDSGGPLQMYNPTTYCTYTLYGVTSFGRECGSSNGVFAVYTRVSAYVDWIESVVWPNEN